MSIPANPSPPNHEDAFIETLSIVPTSDLSTNYTETGLIGAGRTLGIFYSYAGRRLERVVGKVAHKAGYGPQATYLKIQELLRTEWKVDDKKSKFVSLLFSIYTTNLVFTISFQSPYYANYVSRCLTM